jgi:hypothetical protein
MPFSDLVHTGVNVGLTEDSDNNTWNNPPSLGLFELYVDLDNPEIIIPRARIVKYSII